MRPQAGNGKEILALHVVQIPQSMPPETELTAEIDVGEAMLAKAQVVAEERFDLEIKTELLQAREAAPAILEEAKEKGVDLIILGYNRRGRFGDRLLKATALEDVVRDGSRQLLLSVSP